MLFPLSVSKKQFKGVKLDAEDFEIRFFGKSGNHTIRSSHSRE
jgi:hypothetical protein